MDEPFTSDVIRWADLGYTAKVTEIHDYDVSFELRSDGSPDDDPPDLVGHVKWDGCSNWMTPSGEDYDIHCCGRGGLLKLGEAMARCWDLASTLCPNWHTTETTKVGNLVLTTTIDVEPS